MISIVTRVFLFQTKSSFKQPTLKNNPKNLRAKLAKIFQAHRPEKVS